MRAEELAAAGREAARRVWREGVRAQIDDPFDARFAHAAIDEFGRLQRDETPGIIRDALEGAAMAGGQLDVEPFHGVIEVLQNADDAGASELRMAVRPRGRSRVLLFVHDGKPVRLNDVIAMGLAFVSTKREQAYSKGRFGIGLKTLRVLGPALRVHSGPYHASVSISGSEVTALEPTKPIQGLFNPSAGDTLIELELDQGFKTSDLKGWLQGLDASLLLFLDSVRTFTLAGARSSKPIFQLALRTSKGESFDLSLGQTELTCAEEILRAGDGRSWRRYSVDRPVPASAPKRLHKQTGPVTPLAVAVPDHGTGRGRIFAGLPLPTAVKWPFSINAQFDIDTPRKGVQKGDWNKWLLGRMVELVTGVARHRFNVDPGSGWTAVPLPTEAEEVPHEWLRAELEEAGGAILRRTMRGLGLRIKGADRQIRDLIFEAKELERLVSPEDLALIDDDGTALPKTHRDRSGRWRLVLAEHGEAYEIGVESALALLDLKDAELGERGVNWFIRFARAAISAGEGDALRWHQSMVLNDGSRVAPPAPDAQGELLVKRTRKDSLAARLGLARVIHRAYLTKNPEAAAVRRWLEREGILATASDDRATLRALASRGRERQPPLEVSDADLLDLRTALLTIQEEEQAGLGAGVGAGVLVDGFSWARNKQSKRKVRPADSYLPKTLEDRPDGWCTAANKTPGLTYVAARYAQVIRKSSAKGGEFGAARFFRLLGCEIAPHLRMPEDSELRYGELASPIDHDALSASQRNALGGEYASHMKGDRSSDDLSKVVEDIARDRSKKRRGQRANALVRTLGREWDRLFADHTEAPAVTSYYQWQEKAKLPASWLAVAMDTGWLNDSEGTPRPPVELAVRTPATEAIHGLGYDSFAIDLDAELATSPAVRALGIETDPRVSEIVELLGEMRESGEPPDMAALATRYFALNAAVTRVDAGQDELVGDLTVRQLRSRFGTDPRRPGLVFTGQGWRRPREVFRGAPIFGDLRPFVPESRRAGRLWRMLGIPEPGVDACVAVLRKIAKKKPDAEGEEIVVNTLGRLETLVNDAKPQSLAGLGSVPLWTGNGWTSKRPVFAVDSEELSASLAGKLAVWQPPLVPSSLGALLEHLGVRLIELDEFEALVDEEDVEAGEPYRETFARAVAALQEDLARHDRDLSRSIEVRWDDLAEAEIALASGFQLTVKVPGRKPVRVPARAHLSREPLRLSVADIEDLGDRYAGGKAIASLFPPEGRHKAEIAWSVACEEALKDGDRPHLRLAGDPRETDIEDLFEQAKKAPRKPKRRRKKDDSRPTMAEPQPEARPAARRLKDPEDLTVVSVDRPSGSKKPKRHRGKRGLRRDAPEGRPIHGGRPAPPSAPVAYSSDELQERALLALNTAVNGELSDLRDFQHLRGVGADALDRLKRFFEIKSTAGPMKDQVDFTINEFRRAVEARGKFYLALVSGLEVGYETVVRIIPDPASSLEVRRSQGIRLAGILSADKPIEVRFD